MSKIGRLFIGAVLLSVVSKATPITHNEFSTSLQSTSQSLAKRDTSNILQITCGSYSTADNIDTWHGYSDHQSKTDSVNIGANTCGRIGCYNYAGQYLCNKQDVPISVPLGDAGRMIEQLSDVCKNFDQGEGHQSISGEMFVDGLGGYSAVIAFCNPSDDSNSQPGNYPDYGYTPAVVCGEDGQPTCDLGQCQPGRISIESVEDDVVCDAYLASTYTNAGGTLSYSQTRTVTTGWTIGGSLGINLGDTPFVGTLEFTGSYTNLMSIGTTDGSIGDCGSSTEADGSPGLWTCATLVQPSCYRVNGTCETDYAGIIAPYSVVTPKDNGTEGMAVTVQSICTCQNCIGWGDVGAPGNVCPIDCAACKTH